MTEVAKPVVEKARWVDISVILPVRDEAGRLEETHRELKTVLETINASWEIIFVDDGSTDETSQLLRRLATDGTKALVLARSFGKTAALAAGLEAATGGVIITMDADGQDDPAEIPRMISLLGEGYEVVSGWRYECEGARQKRPLFARPFNRLITRLAGVPLHDFECSLRAYDRRIFEGIHLYRGTRRLLPAIASWMGAEVAEIKINHRPRRRRGGRGLSRAVGVLLEVAVARLLLSNSARAIRVFGKLGLLFLAGSAVCGVWALYERLARSRAFMDSPPLFLAALFFVVALQLLSLGLLGEISIRAHHESQSKPGYYVKETIG